MAGTIMVSKKLLDRLRDALKRYGKDVLGDPSIGIHFLPTEFEDYLRILLTSGHFQNMGYFERQDSVWDYLRKDPLVTNDDLSIVSTISMETEDVEFI